MTVAILGSRTSVQTRAMCPRRRAQSSHEPYEPVRGRPLRRAEGTKDLKPHLKVLNKLRKEFGGSFNMCHEASVNAEKDHSGEGPIEAWLRMVKHKIIKRYHHKLSQLLKEVKEIKLGLD